MAHFIEHIIRDQAAKLRAHACRWAMLPVVTVPSAAVDDEQTAAWGEEIYERALADERKPRAGEESVEPVEFEVLHDSRGNAVDDEQPWKQRIVDGIAGARPALPNAAAPPRIPWRRRTWHVRTLRRRLGLAFFGAILAGCILGTGIARANPVDDYTVANAWRVCRVLDQFPSTDGVMGVLQGIVTEGLTATQAGEVVARAVIGWCPVHMPEVKAFVAQYAPNRPISSGVGGRIA